MNKKMKLKNTSKKIIRKSFIYMTMIYIIFAFTFYYSLKNSSEVNNTKFINFLLEGGNSHMMGNYKITNIVNSSVKFLLNIDLKNPSTILNNGVLVNGNNDELLLLEHNDDYSNLDELKKISSYMEDPNPVDINNPIIYIYNSHQLENYNSENLDIYGITPNVLMASYILKEKLNSRGLSTIVEDVNLSEFLNLNNWDYASSYKASRIFMLDKKNKYSSLKYYIDIHRDSVSKEVTTTNINGKAYAKILFVIGLEHDNYKENLAFSEELNNLVNKYYNGLSRGIYKKEGPGVDGIYNQDISPNTILIEVGGVGNNINEVLNTMEALSNILDYYINGDKNE
ncbi:MAG: stage II sporulation protein P [Bacilli bacterium]